MSSNQVARCLVAGSEVTPKRTVMRIGMHLGLILLNLGQVNRASQDFLISSQNEGRNLTHALPAVV